MQGHSTDGSNALNALEVKLQQQDAVMEPDVLSLLRKYVSSGTGGNPGTAVEMLSENYVGEAAGTQRCCHLLAEQHSV